LYIWGEQQVLVMVEPAHCAGYHVFDNNELLMWLNEILVGKLKGFDAWIIVGGCKYF